MLKLRLALCGDLNRAGDVGGVAFHLEPEDGSCPNPKFRFGEIWNGDKL